MTDIRIATILPVPHLHLAAGDDFHLCLAHLLGEAAYSRFFRWQASRPHTYVVMDNGVIETGEPMPIERLADLAYEHQVDELVLPDQLGDAVETLNAAVASIKYLDENNLRGRVMAVPHGQTAEEWAWCVREMLSLPIDCIGISRTLVPRLFEARWQALEQVPELLEAAHIDIHLLGCPDSPVEIGRTAALSLGRVRSVDSGVAAIHTQVGSTVGKNPKPDLELDFLSPQCEARLQDNVERWKQLIRINS